MPDQAARTERLALMALIGLGVILRLWIRYPTDFWEDEIIASTHAMLPLWQVVVDTIRNDTHPPLYFLQLHLWGWLGQSDVWLTLNSVAWSLAALFSIWWTARRLYGERVALYAAAIFASLPAATYNADQLRMYSMLSTMLIWAFYFSVRIFGKGQRTAGLVLGHIALLVAIVNTHAIAAVAVFINGLYAFSLAWGRRRDRAGLPLWLAVYGFAALCALPWLVSGMLHDANLGDSGGLAGIFHAVGSTAVGNIVYGSPLFGALGVMAFLAVAALGLASPRTRILCWIYLLLPIALSIAMGLVYKPLFKWNFFSTLAGPFIALIPALALEQPLPRLRKLYVPLLIALLCTVSIATRLTVYSTSGYRDRANLILANYRPGDLVFAPQMAVFWGTAWYVADPQWGSPLFIAGEPSAQWLSVYRKLGPRIVGALHLMPETQMLERDGFHILVGNDSAAQAQGASRIWLLTMPRVDLKAGYPPPTLNGMPIQWSDHNHTWVTLYAAVPQQVNVPPASVSY